MLKYILWCKNHINYDFFLEYLSFFDIWFLDVNNDHELIWKKICLYF